MKPNINRYAYFHPFYGIILDLGTNRLMNSLWIFNTCVPRGGSMFGFLVIFLSLSACLYSKLHEARDRSRHPILPTVLLAQGIIVQCVLCREQKALVTAALNSARHREALALPPSGHP